MAVGAVQAGYNTYSYPAKEKSKETAESMLCDLEHPLAGEEAKSKEVLQYLEQEKEFYRALIRKLEENAAVNDTAQIKGNAAKDNAKMQDYMPVEDAKDAQDSSKAVPKEMQERMDYQKFLQKKIEELFVKFQNGESEPSYQIGAASFTEREWDKLLEKFDAIQDTIRTQMREEHAKRAAEWEKQAARRAEIIAAGQKQEQAGAAGTVKESAGQQSAGTAVETARQQDAASTLPGQETSLLAGVYTSAAYPPNKPEGEPIHYITCYTQDGIFCRRAGNEGYEWTIRFANREEYSKVMQFLEQFPSDWNMRFASNETFWKDFLDDRIDLERFGKFLEGTDKGVPDYTITVGDSMYIDRDKVQWAKYLNRDIGKFYTAQEMQAKLIEQNTAKMPKLTDLYENIYRQSHPEYRGERIFCEYPGDPLYTANEIGKRMYQKYLESKLEIV